MVGDEVSELPGIYVSLGGLCKDFGFCSEGDGELPEDLPSHLDAVILYLSHCLSPALIELSNYTLFFPGVPSLEGERHL